MTSLVSWFADHGISIAPQTFSTSTHTAQQAADSLGIEVGQIAKSILFITSTNTPILVIASGANRVDETKLADRIGQSLRKADKHEVKTITGYEIGGVPPVAHLQLITTYFDSNLLRYPTIWASAGTPNSVFEIEPNLLLRLTNASLY